MSLLQRILGNNPSMFGTAHYFQVGTAAICPQCYSSGLVKGGVERKSYELRSETSYYVCDVATCRRKIHAV